MSKKVLLIRLDKIGDLICTLCVDQISFLKDCETRWVIAKGLGFIPNHADPQRSFIELSEDWRISLKSLRAFLKEFQPDVAISFQAPWWVNFALWSENIPIRAGVKSQWHSFLFLNKGLRQRRSLATKHESEYNMDLLRFAMNILDLSEPAPVLKLQAPSVGNLFEKYQLLSGKYVVVHPGMAGSALNWPISYYLELIQELKKTTQVVITGTTADEPWLTEIKQKFKHLTEVLILQESLSAKELLIILRHAKAVVVPSTGIAHIAASLNTPVLGIYSPITVQHPRRWAARGPKVQIYMPKKQNSDQVNPACMEEIRPEELLKALSLL